MHLQPPGSDKAELNFASVLLQPALRLLSCICSVKEWTTVGDSAGTTMTAAAAASAALHQSKQKAAERVLQQDSHRTVLELFCRSENAASAVVKENASETSLLLLSAQRYRS